MSALRLLPKNAIFLCAMFEGDVSSFTANAFVSCCAIHYGFHLYFLVFYFYFIFFFPFSPHTPLEHVLSSQLKVRRKIAFSPLCPCRRCDRLFIVGTRLVGTPVHLGVITQALNQRRSGRRKDRNGNL